MTSSSFTDAPLPSSTLIFTGIGTEGAAGMPPNKAMTISKCRIARLPASCWNQPYIRNGSDEYGDCPKSCETVLPECGLSWVNRRSVSGLHSKMPQLLSTSADFAARGIACIDPAWCLSASLCSANLLARQQSQPL